MHRDHPAPARQRFRLVPGEAGEEGETRQLDRFLASPDPFLIASLRKEEQGLRRRKKVRWSLAILLGLAAATLSLWLSGLLPPEGPANRERARQLVEQGRVLASEDRYEEALANFSLAARLAPDLADAWSGIGSCQLSNYQSELAERAYLQALALEPRNLRALQGLGHLYLRRGEEGKAESVWLQGGLDRQLAGLYLLQGRFREAQVHLASLRADVAEDNLLYRMSEAAASQRLEPALRSLLEPEPTGMSPWADLGWRLSRQEQYSEASLAFRKALAEVPYDVNALSGLGWSLLALDQPRQARVYFERALSLDHDHSVSLNGLAHCLKSEGRIREAIAVWQKMAVLYPGVNYGTPGLAWTYYELRDYRQAAVYFARIVKRYPYDSRVIDALNIAVENIGTMSSH